MGLRGSQVDELVCPPSALSWGGLHAMLESDHGSRTLPPQNLYDLIRKTLVDVLGEDGVLIVDHEAVQMSARQAFPKLLERPFPWDGQRRFRGESRDPISITTKTWRAIHYIVTPSADHEKDASRQSAYTGNSGRSPLSDRVTASLWRTAQKDSQVPLQPRIRSKIYQIDEQRGLMHIAGYEFRTRARSSWNGPHF